MERDPNEQQEQTEAEPYPYGNQDAEEVERQAGDPDTRADEQPDDDAEAK